jgi:hypothetical protein
VQTSSGGGYAMVVDDLFHCCVMDFAFNALVKIYDHPLKLVDIYFVLLGQTF